MPTEIKREEYIQDFGRGYKRRVRFIKYDDGSSLMEHLDLIQWTEPKKSTQ